MSPSNGTFANALPSSAVRYLDPRLLRLFRTGHNFLRDLRIVLPASAFGVLWELGRHDALMPAYLPTSSPALTEMFIRSHVEQWFPVLVAALLYSVLSNLGGSVVARASAYRILRRLDEATVPSESATRKTVRNELAGAATTVLGVLFAAFIALSNSSGDFWTRYVPSVVAILLAYVVRRGRRRSRPVGAWQPTYGGFRPSLRALLAVTTYQVLRSCGMVDVTVPILPTGEERRRFRHARDLFVKRRDIRSAAWSVARVVEYHLQCGDLATAEPMLDDIAAMAGLAEHPTVAAARASVLLATGRENAALEILTTVRDRLGWRTPRRLRDRIVLIEACRDESHHATRRVRRCYRRMGWRRQYDEIAASLLAVARRTSDEGGALATAAVVRERCDAVLREFAHEIDATRVVGLFRAQSDAWRIQADHAVALHDQDAAVIAYRRAHEAYVRIQNVWAAGECLLLSAVAAANAGRRDGFQQIDTVRSGICLLQDRLAGSMSALRAERHNVYRQVFDVVARNLWLVDPEEAGSICLWLLESLHRDALADVLSTDGPPIDIGTVITQLDGNCALLYDATRDDDGWSFRTVVVSRFAGIMVHTSKLPAVAKKSGRSWFLTPQGILDALGGGAVAKVASAYGLPLDDAVWREIADAVLPPTLGEVLRRHAARQVDPVLLVVPDGPIASLPLAGMLLRDGSTVIEHAGVAFTPSLTLLSPPDRSPHAHPAVAAVYVHSGSRATALGEIQAWSGDVDPPVTRVSDNQAELRRSLTDQPAPDLAVIAVNERADHDGDIGGGVRTDDAVLSARSALSLPWPATVVLRLGRTRPARTYGGREPIDLPMACLVGGARTVVTELAAIGDTMGDDLLALLGADLVANREPTSSLRFHLRELAADDLRKVSASWWVALTIWTTRSPESLDLTGRTPPTTLRTRLEGDRAGPDVTSNPECRPRIGERLSEAMRYAADTFYRTCVTTLEFISAACDVDYPQSANWTAFTIVCGVASQPAADRPHRREPDEAFVELTLNDGGRILVSARLARAVEIGGLLASQRGEEVIAPRHVAYGVLADESSDATRWLTSGVEPLSSAATLQALGDRLFSADLPDPTVLRPREPNRDQQPPAVPESAGTLAERYLATTSSATVRKRTRRVTAGVVVMAVLAVGGYLKTLSDTRDSERATAFIGVTTTFVTTASGSPVTSVVGVIAHGPAATAGLHIGDVVLDIDGLSGPEPSDISAAVHRHHPGDVVDVTVRRDGVVRNFAIRLSDALTGLGLAGQP